MILVCEAVFSKSILSHNFFFLSAGLEAGLKVAQFGPSFGRAPNKFRLTLVRCPARRAGLSFKEAGPEAGMQ